LAGPDVVTQLASVEVARRRAKSCARRPALFRDTHIIKF
jgi:hypothetical protein